MFPVPEIVKLSPSFGKVTCESTWRWDTLERPMTDHDLWYVWGGEGEVERNGVSRRVSKGCCFLFQPGDLTLGRHNPLKPLIVTYIHFDLNSPSAPGWQPYRKIHDILVFETFLNRYVQTMQNKDDASEEEANMLLKLLLLQFSRESRQPKTAPEGGNLHLRQAIHEVANYIRQYPGQRHTLYGLAERAGLSPRYFSIKFKAMMGHTVERFLITARIQRAEHLLRFTGMNVTEVAEALGYSNVYFFSKQFKKFRGVNPSTTKLE